MAAASCVLAAGPAGAEDAGSVIADTAIVEIEGTSVLGRRPGTTRGGSSAVRVALDSLALPAAPTLRRAIESLPAVHVRTNSRGEAEISVRGSESRQVAVLWDGLPLTLGWDGRTDVSVIPVGAMREVVFVPGLPSLVSGPNVLGGVIELESGAPAGAAGRSSRLDAGVDDLGAFGVAASVEAPHGLRGGRLTLRAGAGHRDSPGEPLARGVAQPVAADRLRTNTDAAATDGFATLRYDREDGGWASLVTSAFREERGIAAELGVDEPRYWRYPMVARSLTVLSAGSGARRAPWGGAASLRASFGLDVGRTEIHAFDSIGYDAPASEEDGDQRTLSLRVVGSQTLGSGSDLRLGVTSSELTYDETLTPGGMSRYRHRLWSLAGEGVVRLPLRGGALDEADLALGASYDRSTNPLAGGRPGLGPLGEPGARVGLGARFAGGALTAHASASRRARFPSLRELYSGALDRFTPNPDLSPEKLTAVEAGVTIRRGSASLQVVGFVQRLADAVVRIRENGKYRRVNQAGLRSRGAELTAGARAGALSFGADFTARRADLLDSTASLEHPENLPEVAGGVRAEWSLPRGWSAGVAVRHTGRQYALDPDTGELASLPAWVRLDLVAGRSWKPGGASGPELRVALAAENVTDEAAWDAFGLPGPGRRFRLETRILN